MKSVLNIFIVIMLLSFVFLSGCLFPDDSCEVTASMKEIVALIKSRGVAIFIGEGNGRGFTLCQ